MIEDRPWRYRLKEFDLKVYESILPDQHPLIDAQKLIDWDSFMPILEKYYNLKRGKPGINPVLMLKLEFLRYHFNLSDRQVIERGDTDLLLRWFLQIPLRYRLPDSSTLCEFRGRVGAEGFKEIFNQLIAKARQAGIVKDRLRLKDASHVIANIAVPTTIKLLGQLRDRLLEQLCEFSPDAAEGFRISLESMRQQTEDKAADTKLEARVELLRDILKVVEQLPAPEQAAGNLAWQSLQELKQLATKALFDQDNPKEGHRLLSLVDAEARRGKHGTWYDGYVLDIIVDADSKLITNLQVLQAGGDEAKSAVTLVQEEQATHGNKIAELSIDGVGFNGEMLREFAEMETEVTVPPKQIADSNVFANTEFALSEEESHVTCPAGEQSTYKQSDGRNGTIFRFTRTQCDGCPLVQKCMPKPGTGAFGRSVTKNKHETEYRRARERATTAHHAEVRREHPAVERIINEQMNHHGGRRARYWGQAKVAAQQYLTAFTVNIKRMVKQLSAEVCAEVA